MIPDGPELLVCPSRTGRTGKDGKDGKPSASPNDGRRRSWARDGSRMARYETPPATPRPPRTCRKRRRATTRPDPRLRSKGRRGLAGWRLIVHGGAPDRPQGRGPALIGAQPLGRAPAALGSRPLGVARRTVLVLAGAASCPSRAVSALPVVLL